MNLSKTLAKVGLLALTLAGSVAALAQSPVVLGISEDRVYKFDIATGNRLGSFGAGKLRHPKTVAHRILDHEWVVGDVGGIKRFHEYTNEFLGMLYTTNADTEIASLSVAAGGSIFAIETEGLYTGNWRWRLIRIDYSTGQMSQATDWQKSGLGKLDTDAVQVQSVDTSVFVQTPHALLRYTAYDLSQKSTIWTYTDAAFQTGFMTTNGSWVGFNQGNWYAYLFFGVDGMQAPQHAYVQHNTPVFAAPGFNGDVYRVYRDQFAWRVSRYDVTSGQMIVTDTKKMALPRSTNIYRIAVAKV